jgi:hypothetical protein
MIILKRMHFLLFTLLRSSQFSAETSRTVPLTKILKKKLTTIASLLHMKGVKTLTMKSRVQIHPTMLANKNFLASHMPINTEPFQRTDISTQPLGSAPLRIGVVKMMCK